ncbi:hypothetical protein BB558_000028 [Smittium angustum]|uniref:HMG box domain-containing protein n=1 Tax=Smittium angustum TaxID=133377 RepID=A0A2U1JFD3_SMIAN|nr:hypothetical protein BB558_000028 [Smittium angustum]
MSNISNIINKDIPIFPSNIIAHSAFGSKVVISNGYTPILIPNRFLTEDYHISITKLNDGKIEDYYSISLNQDLDSEMNKMNEKIICDHISEKLQRNQEEMKVSNNSVAENINEKMVFLNGNDFEKKVPAKPPNAFILYRRDWHKKLLKSDPKSQAKHISSKIAEQWKNESSLIKQHYLDLAYNERKKFKVSLSKKQRKTSKPLSHLLESHKAFTNKGAKCKEQSNTTG